MRAHYPLVDLGFVCDALSQPVLAAAIFLSAYISWRPGEILFTLSDALFVLAMLLIAFAGRVPLLPFASLTPYWLFAVVAMMIGLYVGSIVNGDPVRWLIMGAQYLFSFVLLPLMLMGQSPRRTIGYFKALVAGVTCMESFGIALDAYYKGAYAPLQRFGLEFVTGGGRLTVFLGDANWNAAIIAMTLPFLYYLRIRRHIGIPIFLVALAILLTALLLAASVTGTICALLATMIFIGVGQVRLPKKAVAACALGLSLAAISGVAMPHAFQNRVAGAVESGDIDQAGTFVGRVGLIEEAWNLAGQTILIGKGSDQYRKISEMQAPVHNLYLLIWVEGGLASLAALLWMNGLLVLGAASAFRYNRIASALAFSVLATFIIFSNAAPHLYARLWMVPLLLAMAPVFGIFSPVRSAGRFRHARRQAADSAPRLHRPFQPAAIAGPD